MQFTCVLVFLSIGISVRVGTEDEADPNEFRGGHEGHQFIGCEFKKFCSPKEYPLCKVESDFLQMALSDPQWTNLVPKFFRNEDYEDHKYLVMENKLCTMKHPVIADFKLGTQSWEPDFKGQPRVTEEKKQKMDLRDRESTTKQLGVRITSAQLPPSMSTWEDNSIPDDAKYQLAGRRAKKAGLTEDTNLAWVGGSNPADFKKVFKAYLPTPQLKEQFVELLEPYIELFKSQTTYHFTGASLFVWYDAENAGSNSPKLGMALIDLAHALGTPEDPFGEIDQGVLTGLTTLKNMAISSWGA